MNSNSTPQDDTIDLKELFFSLLSQWKLIALCTLLSLVFALLYLKVTPNVYSTDAMIQVEDAKGAGAAALLGDLGSALPGGVGGKSAADAEIEILNSRKVLGQTIQDLKLDIRITDEQSSLTHRLLNTVQSKVIYKNNVVTWQDKKNVFVIQSFDVPNFYLDKKLTLNFINGQEFSLSYKKDVVFKGKLNAVNQSLDQKGLWKIQIYAKNPISHDFSVTKLSMPSAVQWIKKDYSVAERGKNSGVIGLNYNGEDKEHITQVLNHILNIYQAQNIERKSLESAQTLSFLEKQLPELKQQLEDSEIKFNRFREQYNTIDVTQEAELMLKQNVELEKLKIQLQQQQAELSSKYTPDHPLMSAINAQLSEINKKTSEMTQSIKRLPETQRLYLQLYRDVKVNTELYTALLNSYQQLKIAKAGEIGNVRIIDTAIEPVKPIKPKKLITLVLAIFVGGFLGTLLALLRNMLRSGIKDSNQIENELDLPVYATVPRSPVQESRINILKKKKNIPILAVKNSDDIAIESLRSMRTAIHFALSSAKNNIIMISGPAPELGKSFISTNLATILAPSDKRVLLIDADLRRGYMHKYFNYDPKPGLTEYLNGQHELGSIVRSTEVENLSFISRGKSPANPSELLSTQKFADMLTHLSSQFDHILIDTPPVLAVTDGIIISQYAGVNLVVARYAKTQMKELELTVNRFEQAGVKVNGFILNDIQRAGAGYGYGYNYSYAYKANKDD